MKTDPSPDELIEALLQGDADARSCLDRWCRRPIDRLVGLAIERRPGRDREALVGRTLRWAEMYLRSRGPSAFSGMGRNAFIIAICVAAYRVLCPHSPGHEPALVGNSEDRRPAPEVSPLPESRTYRLRSLSRPFDEVGGDWCLAEAGPEDALWIIVADVTGHGYVAHILAAGLPDLWRARRITGIRSGGCSPGELLEVLDRELAACLPEEVFVEATLGRFSADGRISVAGAGKCCVALRRSGQHRVDLHDFGGILLGLGLDGRDQREWSLEVGDELLLSSDGLHEQPCDENNQQLKAGMGGRVERWLASGHDLHDAVLETLEETLRAYPQADDITFVTVSHRGHSDDGVLGHVAL